MAIYPMTTRLNFESEDFPKPQYISFIRLLLAPSHSLIFAFTDSSCHRERMHLQESGEHGTGETKSSSTSLDVCSSTSRAAR